MLAFDMPAGFRPDEIAAIAALANLELEPSEVEMFAHQLGEILAYARQVQQVDTAGVPPTAGVTATRDAARPDLVRPSLARGEALANAPDAAPGAGWFRVPRVIG